MVLEAQRTTTRAQLTGLSRFWLLVTRRYIMSRVPNCIILMMHRDFEGTDGMHYYNFYRTLIGFEALPPNQFLTHTFTSLGCSDSRAGAKTKYDSSSGRSYLTNTKKVPDIFSLLGQPPPASEFKMVTL